MTVNKNRKLYTDLIEKLEPNQIFVFGSNTQGRHSAGAAKFALNKCGAIYGQAIGLQGQSYAIITKDLTKKVHPSIPESFIILQIKELYKYANNHPELEFLIAYSGTRTNLNGYSPTEMAKMFFSENIPNNIVFEENFYKLISELKNKTSLS